MTAAEQANALSRDEIVAWRFGELLRAGYGWDDGLRLAQSVDVDLHVAVDLLERGCPEETALRILL